MSAKRPRLLDLFCGAGGAAMGYHRAGLEVVGVDIKLQPHYPFEFHQGDALEYPIEGFDVVHASPPCQKYSMITKNMGTAEERPDLVGATRDKLQDLLYVIENVHGAPLLPPVIMLCGSMFDLGTKEMQLRRHRYFECPHWLPQRICRHDGRISISPYGHGTNQWHRDKLGRNVSAAEYREAMGIEWMTRKELSQAIPPAYTEWIGRQLLKER